MTRRFDVSLYFITDPQLCRVRGVIETVRAAVAGGATIVQLRDPAAKTRAHVEEARALIALLRPLRIPLIVNDRVDVALAADADGVHVGQTDMHPADARALIGPERILGLSITSQADMRASDLTDIDYLGVGPIFPSITKPDAAPPMGTAGLKAIAARTKVPIVAIGGVDRWNVAEAIEAGADGVAVVSAICSAPDPEIAARDLAAHIKTALEPRR
jgi:thiamine-phosphate pyrophosphorylase